jgi:hypothetical protein
MAKRPEDRYASVLDFASALADAAGIGGSPAFDPTVLGAPVRPGTLTAVPPGKPAATNPDQEPAATVEERGSRRILPLVVGLVVLLAGGVALVFALRSPAPSPAPAAITTPSKPPSPAATADPPRPPPAIETVTVGVEDAPANLTASFDGGGPQPLPIQLVKGSGSHAILFQAPGYRPRTMHVDASKDMLLVLSMQRIARGKPSSERAEPAEPAPASAKERFKRSFNAVKKVWLGN